MKKKRSVTCVWVHIGDYRKATVFRNCEPYRNEDGMKITNDHRDYNVDTPLRLSRVRKLQNKLLNNYG